MKTTTLTVFHSYPRNDPFTITTSFIDSQGNVITTQTPFNVGG